MLKKVKGKPFIFDSIRRKWLVLTPEEWVRQHVVNYLLKEKNIPESLISIEKEINLNATKRRYDIVVYKKDLSIYLIVECKAPFVDLSEETFEQALRYNLILNATFVLITNGLKQLLLKENKLVNELEDFDSN